ncbi:hypothetical protein ACM9XA_11600 [Xanthomonas sacchari]
MYAAPSEFFPAMAAASEGNPVNQKQEPKLSNNNGNRQGTATAEATATAKAQPQQTAP